MITKPIMAYYCEYCGMKFADDFKCRQHERECKRTRLCPMCKGSGAVRESQTKYFITCPKCKGKRRINRYI